MQSITRNIQNSQTKGVLLFIERYWLVLIGLIISIPIVLRYIKDAQTKAIINNSEETEKLLVNSNSNPITQVLQLDKITTNPFYQNLARNIARHLGTNIQIKNPSWLDYLNPRGWTENDKLVFDNLKQIINSGQRSTVVKMYYVLTQRNMLDDVKKYLDNDLLNKLPLFK